jgi:DNA-binding NtrC family response regulator
VPPLRACPEDIPALVEHFLRRFTSEVGVRIRGVTMGALRLFTSYAWPGNVRELEHVIRRLVYMSTDGEIVDARRLPHWLHDARPSADAAESGDPVERLVAGLESLELAPLVQAIEKRLILEAKQRTGGKKIEACRVLGLSRNGLDKKLERYAIEWDTP